MWKSSKMDIICTGEGGLITQFYSYLGCWLTDLAPIQVSEVSAPSSPLGAKRVILCCVLSPELLLSRLSTPLPLRVRIHQFNIKTFKKMGLVYKIVALRHFVQRHFINLWLSKLDGAYASAMMVTRRSRGFVRRMSRVIFVPTLIHQGASMKHM